MFGAYLGWCIDFGEGDIKTGRPLAYRVPAALGAAPDRYVEVERVELLNGQCEDALWVGWAGKPMRPRAVEKRIRWWSEKWFGPEGTFGPHRSRYGIATLRPVETLDAPALGAAVLGITRQTLDAASDRGTRAAAAGRFHAGLAEERAGTEALARNTFTRWASTASAEAPPAATEQPDAAGPVPRATALPVTVRSTPR